MADWIDFGALCVAGAAGTMAWRALKADAKDRRIAVKPYVAFHRNADATERSIALIMKSAGVGPAIISGYALMFKNRQIRGDEDLRMIAGELQATLEEPSIVGHISAGTALASGESLTIINFKFRPLFEDQAVDLASIASRFDAIVTYRSVFEEDIFESKSADSPW